MTASAAEHQPSELMIGFIVSLLTPFLMIGCITDIDLARRAAAETITAYEAASQRQLVTIAQIVAFALTALDSLRLSLSPDVSASMKLKLRGNANALNRSSQHATALYTQRNDALGFDRTPPEPDPAPPEPDPTEVLAALENAKTVVQQAQSTQHAQTTAPTKPPVDRRIDLSWAAAMTDVATEYTAELAHLTPAQRRTHLARVGALSHIARMLGAGDAPPLKARLLGSTTLQG